MVKPDASYIWLSYADEKGFRGGCFIEADDLIEAVAKARQLGISPGGQVLGTPPILGRMIPGVLRAFDHQLLSKEDIDQRGGGINPFGLDDART